MSKTKNNKTVVHTGKIKPDTNRLLAEIASELISKHPELLDDDYFKSQLAATTSLIAAAVLGGKVSFRDKKDHETILYLCGLSMVSLVRENLVKDMLP